MATYDQRIDLLERRLSAALALINGARQSGLLYVALGSYVLFG